MMSISPREAELVTVLEAATWARQLERAASRRRAAAAARRGR
jgi:hypothetical protein